MKIANYLIAICMIFLMTEEAFAAKNRWRRDRTPPVITVPTDITAEADAPEGAIVAFTVTATDDRDASPSLGCTPATGSNFALGTTQVNCFATDRKGNMAFASFQVNVIDSTAPFLTLPENISMTTSAAGAFVSWNTGAVDIVDPFVETTCAPESGSWFMAGETAVNCSATDFSGNQQVGQFSVAIDGFTANSPPEGDVFIVGHFEEDQQLTADTTSLIDNNGLGTLAYQWLRNGQPVTGASFRTYINGDDDVGAEISVNVSYIDGAGNPESVTSINTATVENVNDPPTGSVTISPTANIEPGQILTLSLSAISDADGLGPISYQWLRGGIVISDAVSPNYMTEQTDLGVTIQGAIQFTDNHGTLEQMFSQSITLNDDSLTIADIFAASKPVNAGPVPYAGQRVFYVDQNSVNASDSNDGLSENFPWMTLDRAVNSVAPGDFVYIKGDTDPGAENAIYNRPGQSGLDIQTAGAAGQKIIFRNYPGHTVIIEGDGAGNGIELDEASYHHFYGFVIRNFRKSTEGFSMKTDITIENSEFTQTSVTGLRLRYIRNLVLRDLYVHHTFETGINVMFCTDVVIERVESAYNTDGLGADGDGDGIHVEPGENILIIDSHAHHNGEDGFDVQMNGVLYNVIAEDNPAVNIKTWRRDNSDDTQGSSMPEFSEPFAEKTVHIVNSIIRNAGESGIKQSEGAVVHVYHSVIDNNGEEGIAFRAHSRVPTNSSIYNSIFVNNGETGIELSPGNNLTESNNLFYQNVLGPVYGFSIDGSDITGQAPGFLSAASGDYRLQQDSPAIDKGIQVDTSVVSELLLALDKAGQLRSGFVELGAFERSNSSVGSPSAFTAPDLTFYDLNEGETLNVTLSASDADGDDFSFLTLSPLPANATLDADTGQFSFSPDFTQGSDTFLTYTLELATADAGLTEPFATKELTITVYHVNEPVTYHGLDHYTAIQNRPFHLRMAIEDTDGDQITFTASGLPQGLSIDATTGEITGAAQNVESVTTTIMLQESGASSNVEVQLDFTIHPQIPGNLPSIRQVYVGSDQALTNAIDDAQPGDEIILAPGQYSGVREFSTSGTSEFPISIVADGTVIFDGSGLSSPEVFNFTNNASHIVISGLDIRNYAETFYFRDVHNDISILDTRIDGADNAIRGGNIDDLRVENLTVSNFDDAVFRLTDITNVHFFNVSVSNASEYGFSLNGLVDNVQILNASINNIPTGFFLTGENFHIRNTDISNSDVAIEARQDSSVFVINTIIQNNTSFGLLINDNARVALENSTLAGFDAHGIGVLAASYFRMQNTIVADFGGDAVQYLSGVPVSVQLSSNAYDAYRFGDFIPHATSIVTDPQFVNIGGGDLHLQESSELINAGVPLEYVQEDYSGVMRIGHGIIDIGAYEF